MQDSNDRFLALLNSGHILLNLLDMASQLKSPARSVTAIGAREAAVVRGVLDVEAGGEGAVADGG